MYNITAIQLLSEWSARQTSKALIGLTLIEGGQIVFAAIVIKGLLKDDILRMSLTNAISPTIPEKIASLPKGITCTTYTSSVDTP